MSWLSDFHPCAGHLLDHMLPLIADDMLLEIAQADYGNDVEQHIQPLKLFRDKRIIPTLTWHPAEVLELIRWSQPEEADWKPGSTGRRGHLLRAFACTTLLRSYPEQPNGVGWHSFNETAFQLAESLQALGVELTSAGINFLAWCVQNLAPLDADRSEGAFLGLALLSLTAKNDEVSDDAVVALCRWIDAEVSASLIDSQWAATRRMDWLLSTNYHNLKNHAWIDLGRNLYQWAEKQPTSERATWIALIGRALSED